MFPQLRLTEWGGFCHLSSPSKQEQIPDISWEGGAWWQSSAEEAKNYETAALSALTVMADLWISSVLVSDFSVIHIKLLFTLH